MPMQGEDWVSLAVYGYGDIQKGRGTPYFQASRAVYSWKQKTKYDRRKKTRGLVYQGKYHKGWKRSSKRKKRRGILKERNQGKNGRGKKNGLGTALERRKIGGVYGKEKGGQKLAIPRGVNKKQQRRGRDDFGC